MAKALNSEHVVKLQDGSLKSQITSFLEDADKDEEVVRNVVEFIGKMTGPDYGRKLFLDMDLTSTVLSLKEIVGKDEALRQIHGLVEESTDLKQWFELNKAELFTYIDSASWKSGEAKFEADEGPFDEERD